MVTPFEPGPGRRRLKVVARFHWRVERSNLLRYTGQVSACYTRQVLFESPGIAVVDFRCTADNARNGPEELNPTHSIALIRRGVFRRTHHGDTVVADASHLVFCNAEHPYQYSHPVPGGDDCTILTLETPAALELVARHAPHDAENPERPFRRGHALVTPRAAQLHYEVVRLARQPDPSLALEDAVAELADESVRAAYGSTEGWRRRRHVKAARQRRDLAEATKLAINRHLDAPPSLRTLAGALGCSPFHLSRSFHRVEGLSLREYVRRLRARVAAHHLAHGTSDLTELALRLGYTDHSHFTNAFRREWGHPPSQFRSRHARR